MITDAAIKDNTTTDLLLVLEADRLTTFTVEAGCVGYATIIVHVATYADTDADNYTTHSVHNLEVAVVRRLRPFDVAFVWTVRLYKYKNGQFVLNILRHM